MDRKRMEKMLEYLKNFQLTDLLAIGNIVGAEEKENFDDFVVEILMKFNDLSRQKRRQLLQLARDVYLANKDMARGGVVWEKKSKRVVEE